MTEHIKLLPQLAQGVVDLNTFKAVRTRLVVTAPYSGSSIENERLNNLFISKHRAYTIAQIEEDRMSMLILTERPFRIDCFLEVMHGMEPREYSETLRWVWTDCENPYVNIEIWRELFESELFSTEIFNEPDADFLVALPDTFTVYRGTSNPDSTAMSWTFSKDKAEWFANRWDKGGTVMQREISKENAIFTNSRNEQEFIVL